MGCCHATSQPLIFFENKCVLITKIKLVTQFIHMPDTEGIASPCCFWMTLIWPRLTTLFTTALFLLGQNQSSNELHFIHYKALSLQLSAQNFLNISSKFTKHFFVFKAQRSCWGVRRGVREALWQKPSSLSQGRFLTLHKSDQKSFQSGRSSSRQWILYLHLRILTVEEESIVWLTETTEALEGL